MAPTKRIDATAWGIAGADRFRPRRGPPDDDALRAGSTTHERGGGAATWIPPRNRWRGASQPTLDDVALRHSVLPSREKQTLGLRDYALSGLPFTHVTARRLAAILPDGVVDGLQSVGFPPPCHPSYGRLALAPVGL